MKKTYLAIAAVSLIASSICYAGSDGPPYYLTGIFQNATGNKTITSINYDLIDGSSSKYDTLHITIPAGPTNPGYMMDKTHSPITVTNPPYVTGSGLWVQSVTTADGHTYGGFTSACEIRSIIYPGQGIDHLT